MKDTMSDLAVERGDLAHKTLLGPCGLVRTDSVLPSSDRVTTLHCPDFAKSADARDVVRDAFVFTLEQYAHAARNILFVGLGNADFSCDAFGVCTANALTPTRMGPEEIKLSVLTPGVSGKTGLDTVETVSAVTDRIHPDLVIVADALAARDPARLCCTFQITTAGIAPGSGVCADSLTLNRSSLGCDTIAVGLPTVVRAGVLAADVLESAGSIRRLPERAKTRIADQICNAPISSMIVAPKDVDRLVRLAARTAASAINRFARRPLPHSS